MERRQQGIPPQGNRPLSVEVVIARANMTRPSKQPIAVAGREPVMHLLQRTVADLLDAVIALPLGQPTTIQYKNRTVSLIVQSDTDNG